MPAPTAWATPCCDTSTPLGPTPAAITARTAVHESHLIPLIFQAAVGRRPKVMIYGTDYPTRDGTCVRDYVHTADLAQAHQLAVESLEPGMGRAYNLGSGTGATVLEVLRACEEAVGRPIPHEFADRRPGDPAVLIASPEKIRSELGWSPRYPDIREIVRTAWEWHRRHPDGFASHGPPRPRSHRREPRMKTIAYVVPTYPMPSQTFIRREIAALEARGWTVHRFAMRRFDRELADPADRAEQERTEYILDVGAAGLVRALLGEALGRPRRWLTALAAAVRMGRRSEQGLVAAPDLPGGGLPGSAAGWPIAARGTSTPTSAPMPRRSRCSAACSAARPTASRSTGPRNSTRPGRWPCARRSSHAAFVVAISQFTRSQLCRWCATADWPKIHVVRCGLDEVFLATAGVPVPRPAAAGQRGAAGRAEGPAPAGRGGGAAAGPRVGLRAGHRGRRPDARRARAGSSTGSACGTACGSPASWTTRGSAASSRPRGPWCCPASPRGCRW